MPAAEGERRHGRGGVVADAGQGQQLVAIGRHRRRRDARRSPLRRRAAAGRGAGSRADPRRVRPRPGIGGERSRGRPPPHPGLEDRQDPAHRRLLQHELRHHHRPRRRVAAPGQVPRLGAEPVDQLILQSHGASIFARGSRRLALDCEPATLACRDLLAASSAPAGRAHRHRVAGPALLARSGEDDPDPAPAAKASRRHPDAGADVAAPQPSR